MPKRICLFAGYHKKNIISDYVLYYLKHLAEFADIYYLADCDMPQTQLDKLKPYVKNAWAYRHEKYDFGSWQELIRKIGIPTLLEYDYCIFANDSVFAPLFPMKPIFEKAEKDSRLDAWALNSFDDEFFGSHFFVFRTKTFLNAGIKSFWQSITKQKTLIDVITRYEKHLPKLLRENGFVCKVFCNLPYKSIQDYWKDYIKNGFPLLKIKLFTLPEYNKYLYNWRKFIKKHTTFPDYLIDKHLQTLDIDVKKFDSRAFKIKTLFSALSQWRKNNFRLHFCKGTLIIVLFGCSIYNNEYKNKKYGLEKF